MSTVQHDGPRASGFGGVCRGRHTAARELREFAYGARSLLASILP